MSDSRVARTAADYDRHAASYSSLRRTDPALVDRLEGLFRGSTALLSLGAGQGGYESELAAGRSVVGLDLSLGMLAAEMGRPMRRVNADMVELPFRPSSFDGVMALQSLHHVGGNLLVSAQVRAGARTAALREAYRVLGSGRLVIVVTDPHQARHVWFWRYFPEALERKLVLQPSVDDIEGWLRRIGFDVVRSVPFHDPMIEGFHDQDAPLSPAFRDSFSEFDYLSRRETEAGIKRLSAAIADGSVATAIQESRDAFEELGGNVTVVVGEKRAQSAG